MRWFKHMTASSDDEKLSKLEDKYGLEGYGFWWKIVEIVAAKVGDDGQTLAEFSPKKWGSLLRISPKKFQTLAEYCANLGLFLIKYEENSIGIEMPNILKYRDEWTERKHKNSGVTREKLNPSRARVQIQNTDTDLDTDTDLKYSSRRTSDDGDKVSEKKIKPELKKFEEDSVPYRLAVYMRDTLKANVPTLKDPDLQKWASEFDKAIRNDKRMEDPKFTAHVIKWACSDTFWRANIQSPKKLREKFDQLTAKMETEAARSRSSQGQNGSGWKSSAQKRLEANMQAGREAKILLFGPEIEEAGKNEKV